MGSTDKRAQQGFAPIAIGLGLTLINLISTPVTNTSVNPARSTGVALYVGGLGFITVMAILFSTYNRWYYLSIHKQRGINLPNLFNK